MTAGLIRTRLGLVAAVVPIAALGAYVVSRHPVLAAVATVLAIGGILVITRPDVLLLVMVAALPWENKLGWPTQTLSLIKLIGAVVMLAYWLRLVGRRRTVVHLPPLLTVVVVLFLWIGISLVVSPDPGAGVAKLLRYGLFFTFFFLVCQLVDGPDGVRRVMRWFTCSVALAALYGLTLFVAGTDSRAAGPVQDPNDFAYLLACTLPFAAHLIATDRWRRVFWAVCFALIAGAMLATFSRGALVGLAALLLWAILTRRVPLWGIAAAIIGGGAVLLLAFTLWKPLINSALEQKQHIAAANTQSRRSYWDAAVKLAERRPLTGVGPARYSAEAPALLQNDPIVLQQPVTHNTYLEILSEDGVPALVLFGLYLWMSWRLLRRVQRLPEDDFRTLGVALSASLVVATVAAVFLSEQLTAPFWLLGGLAVVLTRTPPEAGDDAYPPPSERVVTPKAPLPVPSAPRDPRLPVPA